MPQVSVRRRVFSLPTLISLGVAGAFLFFLATRFDLDWDATWNNIKEMNPWYYLAGFALYYLTFVLRGARWRILARSAGGGGAGWELPGPLGFSRMILAGWFVNAVTWLRLGDAYRAFTLAQESRSGFSWSLGTILAERVLDMTTVFVLVLAGAVAYSTVSDSTASTYMLGASAVMVGGLGLVMGVMKFYGHRVARFLPGRIRAAYDGFHQGTMGSFRQLGVPLALGLLAWLIEVGRLYLVLQALGLSITLPLVVLTALGSALLSTVPTPGGVGAVEPGLTGLLVLGLGRADAVSVTLVDRSITYLSILVVGGLVFVLGHVYRARRARQAGCDDRERSLETADGEG